MRGDWVFTALDLESGVFGGSISIAPQLPKQHRRERYFGSGHAIPGTHSQSLLSTNIPSMPGKLREHFRCGTPASGI